LQGDPNEWKNLAGDPTQGETKARLAAWLPKIDLSAVPYSAQRVLIPGDQPGTWLWEGKPIGTTDSIPGLDND
jgi:hypothetical protein